VQPTSGLTEAEIKKFITDADANRMSDQAKKELADLRNRAETLIYGTENTLREYGSRLDPIALERLQLALDECKYVLESEGDNATRLRESLGRLETEAHALFLTLQSGSAGDGGPGAGGNS
jgi:molecular chaperone DnaK